MDQKGVTDEGYAVTASEIDMNFENVIAPHESEIVVGTNRSETEFTKNKSVDVLEQSSLSICVPQLSESTFMSSPKVLIMSGSPTSLFHLPHEPLNKELPPPYSYKVPRK